MKPKKNIIERAHRDGTIYRTNILLSAAHLAAAISNNLFQEGSDLLQEAGLHVGEIKKLYNNYLTAADRYFADFSTMITDEKTKYAFFSDLDDYTLAFRQLVCVEDSFTPSDEGEEFHPDLQAYLVAKQKQLKEFERMVKECKNDIHRITEKLNLAEYGLVKGQYFIYRGVEYGNVSCNGKIFLHAHRVKGNGELYKKQEILCIDYDETITPLDKFYEPKKPKSMKQTVEEAAKEYCNTGFSYCGHLHNVIKTTFEAGAEWQKVAGKRAINLEKALKEFRKVSLENTKSNE